MPQSQPHWAFFSGALRSVKKVLYLAKTLLPFISFIGFLIFPVALRGQVVDQLKVVTNGKVNTIVTDEASKKIYFGGDFTKVGPRRVYATIANKQTGQFIELDEFDDVVTSSVSDGAGGFFVGGRFKSIGTSNRQYLAHLDANGEVTNWGSALKLNGNVSNLFRVGTKLYVAGEFTGEDALPSSGAIFDQNGYSVVNGFPDINGAVGKVISDGAGGWYVAGDFTSVGGVARANLAHINSSGTVTSFFEDQNIDGAIRDLELTGTNLIVAGDFQYVNRIQSTGIVIDNTNAILESYPKLEYGPSIVVSDGVGGWVMYGNLRIDGVDTGDLTHLKADGSYSTTNLNADGGIGGMVVGGNTLYLYGAFTEMLGAARAQLAAVDLSDLSLDQNWHPVVDGQSATVSGLTVVNSDVAIYGDFKRINGETSELIGIVDGSTGQLTSAPFPVNLSTDMIKTLAFENNVLFASIQSLFPGGNTTLKAFDATTSQLISWSPSLSVGVKKLIASGGRVFASCNDGALYCISASTGSQLWSVSSNGIIDDIAVRGTRAYAAGSFTQLNGNEHNYVGAVDILTGSLENVPINANGAVGFLSVSGSNMFLGGQGMSKVGGEKRDRVLVVNTVTSLIDSWSAAINGPVWDVKVVGGNLLVGGEFTQINLTSRGHLASLSLSGATLQSWAPDVNGKVSGIATDGNTVFYSGDFTLVDGQPRTNLAASDVTTGNLTSWDPQPDGTVHSLFNAGSSIFCYGAFQNIGGQGRNYMAEFDFSGNLTSWQPETTLTNEISVAAYAGDEILIRTQLEGFGETVLALSTATGDRLAWQLPSSASALGWNGSNLVFVGQSSVGITTNPFSGLVLIDATTGEFVKKDFNLNGSVMDFELNGSTLFVAGTFTRCNNAERVGLVALDAVTGNNLSWNAQSNNSVLALGSNSTTLYATGYFSNIGGQARNALAGLDLTTGLATGFTGTLAVFGAPEESANDLYATEGHLYVANPFGNPYLGKMKIPAGTVENIISQPDNKVEKFFANGTDLYMAGDFSGFINGSATAYLSGISMQGDTGLPFDAGLNGKVATLTINGDNVFIGGEFVGAGMVSRPRLAAVDATNGLLLPWSPEAGGPVNKMLKNGDHIYLAGDFQGIGIENRQGLARVSATTGALSNWNPSPNGSVYDIVANKGKFYIAGGFTQVSGSARNFVARIDSLTGIVDSWAPTPDNQVLAIDVKDDIVYLAGAFANVNGTARKTIAAVSGITGSLTNWDPAISFGPLPASTGIQALSESVVISNAYGVLVAGLDGATKQISYFSTVNRLTKRDGHLIMTGSFSSLGTFGTGVAKFASLTEQSSGLVLDSYPRYSVSGGINTYAQLENKLVIGGQITVVNGEVVGNIALVPSPFQVITVSSPGTKALGSGTFNLGASISSGQTMTFASSDENVATINSQGEVSLVGLGNTNLTISQAGSSDFQPVSTSVVLKVIASDPLPPPNLQFSNILTTGMDLSWDAPSGNPAGYIVLGRLGQAPTAIPADEITYAANDVIGDGKVAYVGTSTSVALSSLVAGSEYFFKVYSFNGTGSFRNYSAASAAGSSFTLPQSPSLNAFSGIEKDAFVINWGAITGAQGYRLDISTDNFATFVAGYESKQLGAVTTTSVSGLASGTQYSVRLAAFNAAGVSTYSSTATVLTKPRAPSNLSFSAVKSTGFTLSWGAQPGVDNYFLDLSTDNFQTLLPGFNNFSLSNVTQYVFTGLQSEVRHYVRLRASNGSGISDNSLAAEQVTVAQQPIAQPTSLSFDNITSTELRGTFVVATGSPAGYLVLMSETKNPEQVPADGVSYVAGTMLGDEKVVFAGTGNSFTVSGLSAASKYYFSVFSYGGSGGGTNYLETAPLTGSRATLALQPQSQPSGLVFVSAGTTSMELSINGGGQSVDGYLVLARPGLAVADLPTDGVAYAKGTTIGQSTVVHTGAISSFEVTSLVAGAAYHYAIFAFNGTDETTNYLVTNPLIGSKTTLALEPASQATNLVFSNISPGSVRVSWTNSVGNGRLLLARKLNLSQSLPSDGTVYTANQNFGAAPDLGDGSRVLYTGTSNTADISGLEPESVYAFKVLEWSGAGESTNYLGISNSGNPASVTTLALPPESQPGVISFSDVTENSMKVSFVPSADVSPKYLVIRKNGSAPTEIPVDGIGYSEGDVMGQSSVVYVGPATTFSLTGLQSDVTYHYAIFAFYGDLATANYLETPSRGSRATLKITNFEMTAPRMDAQRAFAAGNTVEVDVTGATGTLSVTLHWRTITDPGVFREKSMSLKTGTTSTYSVTLTEDMRDEMGMEFYLTATDATATIPDSETRYYLYRVFPATEAITFANQFDGSESSYQMFSIPYVPTDASIANIFNELGAYNKDVWRLYHYEPSREANVEFLSGLSNQISPGRGYWFNTVRPLDESVQVGAGKVVEANQSESFKLNLERGWNQIGNPLPFDIDWQTIRDANSDAGLNRLWYYAGTNTTPFTPDPVLRTWKGAFVFSDSGGEVEFPVLSRSSGRKATETLGVDLDGENWKIDLHLETDVSAAEARIGMHPNARTTKDKFDEIALPRFFSHLEMTTLHPEFFAPRFMNDVAPPLPEYAWVFSLSSSHANSLGKITWNMPQLSQARAAFMLIDLESQTWVDMKTTGEYSFTWKEGRQIKIVYSKDGVPKPGITMGGIAYPNPFQSSVAVRILSDGGAIHIVVFDQLGRQVRTIDTVMQKPGLSEVVWDGQDDLGEGVPSGTYVYKLYDAGGKVVSIGRLLKK